MFVTLTCLSKLSEDLPFSNLVYNLTNPSDPGKCFFKGTCIMSCIGLLMILVEGYGPQKASRWFFHF
jgi:hypothetical protein